MLKEIKIDDSINQISGDKDFVFNQVPTKNKQILFSLSLTVIYISKEQEEQKYELSFKLIWKENVNKEKDVVRIHSLKEIKSLANAQSNKETKMASLIKLLPYINDLLFKMNIQFKKVLANYYSADHKPIKFYNNAVENWDIPNFLEFNWNNNSVYIPLKKLI